MTMPSKPKPELRRVRPAGPRCRGGVSSLLRLSVAAPLRLPSIDGFADRLGSLCQLPSAEAFVTPLQPSAGVRPRIAAAA